MPLDKKSELFYHVDKDDKVIGSVTRGEAHSNQEIIHRAACIIVKNHKNQILFQKRSRVKDLYPGYFALSAAGHVSYGESYTEAIERELLEELGIKPKLAPKFLGKILVETEFETEIMAIYEMITSIQTFQFDPSEVEEVVWININKIAKFTEENKVPPIDIEALKKVGYIKTPRSFLK